MGGVIQEVAAEVGKRKDRVDPAPDMKVAMDSFLSGDYQGAWDTVSAMTPEQKKTAAGNDNYNRLVRRLYVNLNIGSLNAGIGEVWKMAGGK